MKDFSLKVGIFILPRPSKISHLFSSLLAIRLETSLQTLALTITEKFAEQLSWRFGNLEKFRWMDLIHPTKFRAAQILPICSSRCDNNRNLSVLYNSSEISLLVQKFIRERDTIHAAKKKELQALLQQQVEEASNKPGERRASVGEAISAIDVEKSDEFELEPNLDIEINSVKEGLPSIQDLLSVIKKVTLWLFLRQWRC